MSDLRQAAQQALEALEILDKVMQRSPRTESAITALRAALAEPQTTHWEGCEAVHPECRKQEPDGISWLKRDSGYFTAPTPRKPLPEEEIVRLMVGEDRVQLLYAKPDDPYFSEFAQGAIRELVESGRAIERAHGIGEQT